jgi:uncharacterized protein
MLFEDYLGNKTSWKVLRLLSEAPTRNVSRDEIKKLTGAGNFALSNALKMLTAFNILKMRKEGKRHYFWFNMASERSTRLLDLFKKEKDDLKGLLATNASFIADVTRKIINAVPAKRIILFGSHAKGTASVQSDYDLCVITEDEINRNKMIALENKLKESVQLHYFTVANFNELLKNKDRMAEEIERDGIILTG